MNSINIQELKPFALATKRYKLKPAPLSDIELCQSLKRFRDDGSLRNKKIDFIAAAKKNATPKLESGGDSYCPIPPEEDLKLTKLQGLVLSHGFSEQGSRKVISSLIDGGILGIPKKEQRQMGFTTNPAYHMM